MCLPHIVAVQPRRAVGEGKGAGARPLPYEPGSTPLTKEEAQEGLASVGSVIRPVIAVRPIVGVRRINRRVIAVGRRRVIAIGGRIVRIGYWICIASVITSSPTNFLNDS